MPLACTPSDTLYIEGRACEHKFYCDVNSLYCLILSCSNMLCKSTWNILLMGWITVFCSSMEDYNPFRSVNATVEIASSTTVVSLSASFLIPATSVQGRSVHCPFATADIPAINPLPITLRGSLGEGDVGPLHCLHPNKTAQFWIMDGTGAFHTLKPPSKQSAFLCLSSQTSCVGTGSGLIFQKMRATVPVRIVSTHSIPCYVNGSAGPCITALSRCKDSF